MVYVAVFFEVTIVPADDPVVVRRKVNVVEVGTLTIVKLPLKAVFPVAPLIVI